MKKLLFFIVYTITVVGVIYGMFWGIVSEIFKSLWNL